MSTKKFEKYLKDKRNYLWSYHQILAGTLDIENQRSVEFLDVELSLLDDIIQHFDLFVKGEEAFLDSA